ncbi:rhodanese-like domain-containing protein [Melioribacter sp. OK-6-Me]|uniref:rhodanese-like domain-containing protein n=1 Tax=unclassified Melioribacter TaxID=2627329 RepID=UPI003ED8A606
MKSWLNKISTPQKLAFIAFMLGFFAMIIGNPSDNRHVKINAKELSLELRKEKNIVKPVELADWIIKGKVDFTLIDVRNEDKFNEYHIPGAMNVSSESILEAGLMKNEKILIYGDDDILTAETWFLLKSAGYRKVYILKDGMRGWQNNVLYPTLRADASDQEKSEFEKLKQVSFYFGGEPRIASGENGTVSVTRPTEQKSLPKLTLPAASMNKAGGKKREGC